MNKRLRFLGRKGWIFVGMLVAVVIPLATGALETGKSQASPSVTTSRGSVTQNSLFAAQRNGKVPRDPRLLNEIHRAVDALKEAPAHPTGNADLARMVYDDGTTASAVLPTDLGVCLVVLVTDGATTVCKKTNNAAENGLGVIIPATRDGGFRMAGVLPDGAHDATISTEDHVTGHLDVTADGGYSTVAPGPPTAIDYADAVGQRHSQLIKSTFPIAAGATPSKLPMPAAPATSAPTTP
jgi:hypothetical protein